jgi:transposase-like protein
METKRRQFSGEFKTRVVLDSLNGQQTVSELAGKYEVHPMQISKWRKEFLKEAPRIFSNGKNRHLEDKDRLIDELYKEVGRSRVEVEWLKKKVGLLP